MKWTGQPVSPDEHEQDRLARLCFLRDGIEHPEQMYLGIEVIYILEVFPLAAHIAVKLLGVVAQELPAQIEDLCRTM